jgi:flagellar basal body-associated protein FliL
VFCLLSCDKEGNSSGADGASNNSAGEQEKTGTPAASAEKQDEKDASENPAGKQQEAPSSGASDTAVTATSPEGAVDETGNQGENDPLPEQIPFNASFENDEFGAVSITGKALIKINDAGERTLTVTEGKWESLILTDQNTKLKESALIPALVLAALAVAGLALGIFNFIFGAKKENRDQLNASIRDVEKVIIMLKDELKAARRKEDEYPVSPADVRNIGNRISAFERDLRNLASADAVDKLSRRIGVLEDDKKTRDEIKKGTLDPLTVFNSWAANPAVDLPQAFYYLQGDFRIRETHTLKESATPSKWISNRYGSAKYLLPNPNSFDTMTNISELYDMDMTRLKTKGQNRIHVVKPCEMADNGYINYPGELQLL